MKKVTLALIMATLFCLPLTSCAKDTKAPSWVIHTANIKHSNYVWKNPVPENAWSGDKKVWAKVKKKNGKMAWISFQNAPKREVKNLRCGKDDWHFSVSWRTDKDSHPGESDEKYRHVGIRCYGNGNKPCPPTQGEAWQNIVNLISGPMPSIPKNWTPDMVYGPWLGSCN
jgi:hypothetical protein